MSFEPEAGPGPDEQKPKPKRATADELSHEDVTSKQSSTKKK